MTVDAETLRDWLEGGEPVTVLDVRPQKERAEWRIPGSLHIDAYEALRARSPGALDGVSLPRDRPVVTVCAAGRTSLLAAEVLRARGFTAYSLEGGMRSWSGAWNTADVAAGVPGMQIVQVRRTGKGCLSYIVGTDGEAAVIDPSVDPVVYTAIAGKRGWKIVSIIETHVHADHLSRALPLRRAANARHFLPRQERVSFAYEPVNDGMVIPLGSHRDAFTALHTPGHTAESTCYLLAGAVLFTGDTLFLRGVGRPDLGGGLRQAGKQCQALYHSLARLRVLPGGTIVLPGHTDQPVAFDGIPLCSPLRNVITDNPLLGLSEREFVDSILARIPATPANFLAIMRLNETGELAGENSTDLEGGSNRCAVTVAQ